jgi:adenosylhomocysteine nucleosidase
LVIAVLHTILMTLEIKPCHFGVIFALGVESGCCEDLLSGSIRIRGSGFFIKEGGLKNRRVVIIRSGAGLENAARAADVLIDGHRPQIVVSAGFAGGLCSSLKRSDILLADGVVNSSGEQITLRQALPRPDSPAGTGEQIPSHTSVGDLSVASLKLDKLDWPGLHVGKLLSVDHVVREPAEKQSLHQRYQAMAVDMESFAVAEVCRRRGVPLCSARIIFDAAGDRLPADIERLLRQKSEPARLGAAISAIWRRPASIKDLWAMKENSLDASARLAKFIERLISLF